MSKDLKEPNGSRNGGWGINVTDHGGKFERNNFKKTISQSFRQ